MDDNHLMILTTDDLTKGLALAVDDLSEKRQATRDAAYATVIRTLSCTHDPQELSNQMTTLIARCNTAANKGSVNTKEKLLALDCLALVIVNMGDVAMPAGLVDSHAVLTRLAFHPGGTAPSVRAQALLVLSLLEFVCTMDTTPRAWMQQLFELIQTRPGEAVREAALAAWGLTATLVDSAVLASEVSRDAFPLFSQLLLTDGDSPEMVATRAIAATNLCLLCEARMNVHKFDSEDDEFASTVDTVLEGIDRLSHSHGRMVGKTDWADLRSRTRQMSAFLSDQEPPSEVFKFGSEKLDINTWQGIIQFDFVRSVLAGGTPLHMAENELLRSVFDPYLGNSRKLVGLAKRRVQSTNSLVSKARSQFMRENRGRNKEEWLPEDDTVEPA